MPLNQIPLLDGPGGGRLLTRVDKTGAPYFVRPYLPSDRAPLEGFYERFEPQRAAQGLPPSARYGIVHWLDSVLARGIHLIACRGDTLIGHALVIPLDRTGNTCEYAVFLDQSERGKGVGTELPRISIAFARRARARRLWLSVEPQNRPAIRSYRKAGFHFRMGTVYSPEPEMILDL